MFQVLLFSSRFYTVGQRTAGGITFQTFSNIRHRRINLLKLFSNYFQNGSYFILFPIFTSFNVGVFKVFLFSAARLATNSPVSQASGVAPSDPMLLNWPTKWFEFWSPSSLIWLINTLRSFMWPNLFKLGPVWRPGTDPMMKTLNEYQFVRKLQNGR